MRRSIPRCRQSGKSTRPRSIACGGVRPGRRAAISRITEPQRRREGQRPRSRRKPGYAWPCSSVLTEEALNVSGAVDHPENLDAVGEWAVEDEITLETLHGPGAHG